MGLGVPFNIASYSLLTIMIAHVTGLQPGEVIMSLGDTHVYLDHIEGLKTQLGRVARPFPKLFIRQGLTKTKLEDFRFEDFVLENYHPHAKIDLPLAV